MTLYGKHESFISKEEADSDLNILQALIPWTRFALSPKSRKIYRYDHLRAGELDHTVKAIIYDMVSKLEREKHVRVAGVFLNLYQDGSDYCPYHKDQYGTDVYTLSLGATRDLLIKPDGGGGSDKITLNSGDLYFMSESLHRDHKHSVPVRKGVKEPRISIVFFTK